MIQKKPIKDFWTCTGEYEDDDISAKRLAALVFDGCVFSSFKYNFVSENILNMDKFGECKNIVDKVKGYYGNLDIEIDYLVQVTVGEDPLTLEQEEAEEEIKEIKEHLSIATKFEKSRKSVIIINYTQEEIVEISGFSIRLYTTNESYTEKQFQEFVNKIIKDFGFKDKEADKKSVVSVIIQKSYGPDIQKAWIKKTVTNIEENYNDDFIEVDKQLKEFIEARSSGIAILRGEPGTGKTSYIRHMINNYPKKYIIITNAVAHRIAEPDYISFLLENKESVFILEDCEQILQDRSSDMFSSGVANILNMADGLMSDIFNIKFICTFNANINLIDEALLRPGRCVVNYEFKKLDEEKSRKLLKKNYPNISEEELNECHSMSLAEIYNYKKKDIEDKIGVKITQTKKKKIGF